MSFLGGRPEKYGEKDIEMKKALTDGAHQSKMVRFSNNDLSLLDRK